MTKSFTTISDPVSSALEDNECSTNAHKIEDNGG